MRKNTKIIAGVLSFSMMFSVTTSAFASTNDYEYENEKFNDLFDSESEYDSFEDIPQDLLDPNYFSEDEIIPIPEEYLDPNNPEALYTTYDVYGNSEENEVQVQAFAIPAAAGVYFIPGIGEVAITVTGAIVIGGATIAAGSWLYNKVSAYFSKKAAEKAASKIPSKLKSSDMKVDLKKFKDKNGNTPASKTSGTFTNGKWKITKDTSGHLGYNGNKKAWKIGNPTRQASLDRSGNIIDK
ncbi:hypothetical protein [Priestia filamentosa]|uniref:hypothetical protein n=1 Tax=Priestia filamentosa TaxID=1402861 RepID=UPI0002ECF67A|nr:hypothetical protein [Priestia filamentosa]